MSIISKSTCRTIHIMDWKSTSIELTSSLLGARVIFATDEWFAIADNLLNPNPPTFDPNAYCSQGKVMDGWESRRRVRLWL
jgi:allantoicase